MLSTIKEEKIERWIINPKDLVISTHSEIPLKTGNYAGDEEAFHGKNQNFGIEPMGLKSADLLSSVQTVDIKREGEKVNGDFTFEPVYKNIPKALWQEAGDAPGNPKLGDAEGTIKDILSGFKIWPANPPKCGNTAEIDQDVLMVDISKNELEFDILHYKINGLEKKDVDAMIETIANNKTRDSIMALFGFDSSEFKLSGINGDCFMNNPLFEKCAKPMNGLTQC